MCTRCPVAVSVSVRQVLGQPPGWQWGADEGLGLLGAYHLGLGGLFIGDGQRWGGRWKFGDWANGL